MINIKVENTWYSCKLTADTEGIPCFVLAPLYASDHASTLQTNFLFAQEFNNASVMENSDDELIGAKDWFRLIMFLSDSEVRNTLTVVLGLEPSTFFKAGIDFTTGALIIPFTRELIEYCFSIDLTARGYALGQIDLYPRTKIKAEIAYLIALLLRLNTPKEYHDAAALRSKTLLQLPGYVHLTTEEQIGNLSFDNSNDYHRCAYLRSYYKIF